MRDGKYLVPNNVLIYRDDDDYSDYIFQQLYRFEITVKRWVCIFDYTPEEALEAAKTYAIEQVSRRGAYEEVVSVVPQAPWEEEI